MFLLILTLILLIFSFYFILNYRYKFWERIGIVYSKPTWFFGNIKNFLLGKKHLLHEIDDIYKSYPNERYVGYFQLFEPHLLIRDPNLLGHIMVKDFHSFHSRGIKIDENLNPLDANMVNLEGPRWKMVRSKLTPTFTSGKLKLMQGLVQECVKDLEAHLNDYAENQKNGEMKEIMAKFTTDVIGRCAFGLEFKSLEDPESEYRKIGKRLFEPTLKGKIRNIIRMINPKILQILSIRTIPDKINSFFINLMDETISYRKENNIERPDFMQLMINIRDQEKKIQQENDKIAIAEQFSDHLLAANMFIFYVAGFETTASTLSYLIYELALNPEIQRKLRDEVKQIRNAHNGIISYDVLNEMSYMDMIISETLRKYNPAPVMGRQCTSEYVIPETSHVIPVGTKVTVAIHSLHHDPNYYPDPEQFIPERFTEEQISARPQYTYMPFGEGPRVCVGLRFAKLEMKLCLSSIITKYEFTTCDKTIVPVQLHPRSPLYTPKHGLWVSIHKI